MEWYSPLIPVGAGLARAILGWFENAIKDRKISKIEWRELEQTVVKFVVMGILIYVPLEFSGVDNSEWIATIITVMLHYIVTSIRKIKVR